MWAGGVTNDECAGQAPNAGFAGAADHGEEAFTGLAAEGAEVHVDARERRAGSGGQHFPVVKADNGDATGDIDAALAQRIGGAAGDLVVAAKEPIGGFGLAIEEAGDGVAAPLLRPAAGEIVAGVRGNAGIAQDATPVSVDMLDGAVNGTPLLESQEQVDQWKNVMTREYIQLSRASALGVPTVLNSYGTTNPGEFFAVATESFFELPDALKTQSPELYDTLRGYYKLDPATWQA